MPKLSFEKKRRETTAKLASLMLANAFIFQEQLSSLAEEVLPIRSLLARHDFVTDTAAHWQMIIEEINYVPIFTVARDILISMPASQDTDKSIRSLANRALEIVSKKAALRHDLMGRIYHLLLLEAKYLGTYYTSVPAATLLLKLTLDIDRWPEMRWSDEDALKAFKIADLACGTGTLLMAASQALTDNYIKFRAAEDQAVDDVALRELHKLIIEDMLHGYDVLPSAVHLTASTLALLAPETCFHKMRLYSLPMGRMQSGQIYLGSIDYITADTVRTQLDLMNASVGAERVGDDAQSVAPLPIVDLCVMNPPFVRSVGDNLLFGSMPADQRSRMQSELAARIKSVDLPASSTAGLGGVFAAVADRHLRPDGRMALVLPAALGSGVAWKKTRDLINHGYVLETVVTSHEPGRWNFSENTSLSEMLLIARKRVPQRDTTATTADAPTQFVNLWRNPKTSADALALGEQISRGAAAPVGTVKAVLHGVTEIVIGSEKYGEAVEVPWGEVRAGPWIGGAFAQTNLVRTAWFLRQGQLYRSGVNQLTSVPIQPLKSFGKLGPDRRDIADGFTVSTSRTPYPAFMGNRGASIRTMEAQPNKWLSPRATAAKGRPLRNVGLLWPRAGAVMIAERSRFNTTRALAVRLPERGLANVWWPLQVDGEDERVEKVLALWLNSTLGILMFVAHRIPTEGPWVQFKKPTIETLPVIDIARLSEGQLTRLASAYDIAARRELKPLPKIDEDPVRADIDWALEKELGLTGLDSLRSEIAKEPCVSGRPMPQIAAPEPAEEWSQFELL
jgi:hypothetical protein